MKTKAISKQKKSGQGRKKRPDVTVENSGLFVFHLHTAKARQWVEEEVEVAEWQGSSAQFVVEGYRYAYDIAQGMLNAGFNVV